jgi:CheY-like chemotaxis protein
LTNNEQALDGFTKNNVIGRFVMNIMENNQSGPEKTPALKILVADDDLLNRRLMKALLMLEGHNVDVVSNGLEAFDAIKFKRFDIVFMDLQMPIMDGIEASRQIRDWEEGGPHTFIVALTASYLPEEGYKLFEVGIDNYIPKPFQMVHLKRMLKYTARARTVAASSVASLKSQ